MYANVLRAGTLNDPRVIQRVSANFVPTHINNGDPTRDKNDPSVILWSSILKQKQLQGQGIWIVAPDGNVIGGMSAEKDGHPTDRVGNGPGAPWKANPKFTDAVTELLDQSLKTFGPVTPRNEKAKPLAYRGAGIKPDGGVRLIIYNRADNGLVFSVPLTKDQWHEFNPSKIAVGEKWTLSEAVARNFAPVLSPHADTRFRPRPGDAQLAELKCEVEAVDGRTARVRFTGQWKVDWIHDDREHSVASATADGIGIYDIEKKSLRSLLLIFDGNYSYTLRDGKPRSQTSSAVVRWRLDGDAE